MERNSINKNSLQLYGKPNIRHNGIMKNNIKKLRKLKGITLEQLADIAGLATSSLCDIQNQKQEPSISSAYRIAGALNKSVYQVFPDEYKVVVPWQK